MATKYTRPDTTDGAAEAPRWRQYLDAHGRPKAQRTPSFTLVYVCLFAFAAFGILASRLPASFTAAEPPLTAPATIVATKSFQRGTASYVELQLDVNPVLDAPFEVSVTVESVAQLPTAPGAELAIEYHVSPQTNAIVVDRVFVAESATGAVSPPVVEEGGQALFESIPVGP